MKYGKIPDMIPSIPGTTWPEIPREVAPVKEMRVGIERRLDVDVKTPVEIGARPDGMRVHMPYPKQVDRDEVSIRKAPMFPTRIATTPGYEARREMPGPIKTDAGVEIPSEEAGQVKKFPVYRPAGSGMLVFALSEN